MSQDLFFSIWSDHYPGNYVHTGQFCTSLLVSTATAGSGLSFTYWKTGGWGGGRPCCTSNCHAGDRNLRPIADLQSTPISPLECEERMAHKAEVMREVRRWTDDPIELGQHQWVCGSSDQLQHWPTISPLPRLYDHFQTRNHGLMDPSMLYYYTKILADICGK